MHYFNKYLLSSQLALSIVSSPGDEGKVVNRTDKTSCFHGACIPVGERKTITK